MKSLVKTNGVGSRYSKYYSWGKLITITGGAQAIVQAVGLICGILIVRLLPTQEYALYTLANTMLGTMTVLADGGITSGVMSQGAKVWRDKEKLGSVLVTGLELRRKFAIGSIIIVTPVLLYLLLRHGATLLSAFLITLSLIPAFLAALSDSLLEIVPKLHQNIALLQKNQIAVSLGRLLLNTLMLFAFPFTFIAILANGIPRIYGNLRLRKIVIQHAATKQAADEEVKKDILKVVRRIMPSAIYYCFISQISIWLITIFGSTTSIAQLGALGRLGMVMSFFSVLIATLFTPRFARIPEQDRKLILIRFVQIFLMIIGLSLLLAGITFFFPTQILFVLGNQYSNMIHELFLSVIGSCLGLLVGTLNSLCLSRSYVLSPIVNIGVHVTSQIILILILPLRTTENILIFSIIDYTVISVMITTNFLYYVYKTTALPTMPNNKFAGSEA